MFAQVIVDIAHSQTDKIFEYSCGTDLKAGSRVKVPFGGRVIDGFVVGTGEKIDDLQLFDAEEFTEGII